jgi:hypothetical protein
MPHTEPSCAEFTTEITPTAWMQIAYLPHSTYCDLVERLLALAKLASQGRHPVPLPIRGEVVETSMSFVMGDMVVLYEADFRARVIRLREVARRLPTAPLKSYREVAGDRAAAG